MQPFDPSGRYGTDPVLTALRGGDGGRTVDFRYELLDRNNSKKADLYGVIAGSVQHDATADIKRTASFTLREGVDTINYLQDRIKPWWRLLMPDGQWVEWPQGVFLLSSPARTVDPAGVVTRVVQAYDQTVILQEDAVTDRYSIPAGTLFIDAMTALYSTLIPAASITATSQRLPVTWDYEAGTSKLTILTDLLAAINYRSPWFDENGTLTSIPYVLPQNQTPTYTYATDYGSVITGDIDQSLDLFNVPNVFTLVVSDTDRDTFSSTYSNLSTSSPTSVPSRGRRIVSFDAGQTAADQATLDALVLKVAYEASQVYETESVTTAVMPFHQNADVFYLTVDGLGLVSVKVEELSWSFDLLVGGMMSHQFRRVVSVAG